MPDRLRVLIATAMYPTAENPVSGTFVRSQVSALRDREVEVEVMHLTGGSQKLNYLKAPMELRRRLKRGHFDVVHAHYSYVGMVARTQWRVPLVVTFHGDDILGTVDPRGKTSLASRIIVPAGKLLGRLADAVIVQNRHMATLFRGPQVHIIPHEVDFDLFHPTPRDEARRLLDLDAAKPYLLFAADPAIAVKRFPLAESVTKHLQEADPDIELIVVHKEPQDRLALYMSACDALVFPSFQEGSPNIVKQAMACNLPIVATDVGDVREVIGGTEGCYVCEPTVDAFATALRTVLDARHRTEGREQIRRFDRPVISDQIIRVYEQVRRRRAAPGQSEMV